MSWRKSLIEARYWPGRDGIMVTVCAKYPFLQRSYVASSRRNVFESVSGRVHYSTVGKGGKGFSFLRLAAAILQQTDLIYRRVGPPAPQKEITRQ